MAGYPPEHHCFVCENIAPITLYCWYCKKSLCDNCKQDHLSKRSNRFHDVISLYEDNTFLQGSEPSETVTCNDHPGNSYLMHCRKCDVSCCAHCLAFSHQEHECVPIHKVIVEKAETLSAHVAELEACLKEFEKGKLDVTDHQKQYELTSETIIQTVCKKRDQIKGDVERICDKILQNVASVQKYDKERMEEATDELLTKEQDLKNEINACKNKLVNGGIEIVIQNNVRSDPQKFAVQKTSLPEPLFFEESNNSDTVIEQQFGNLFRLKGSSSGPSCIPYVDMDIQESFTVASHKYPVVAANAKEAWFTGDMSLVKKDDNGHDTKVISLDFTPHDFVLTKGGDFIASDRENKCIKSIDNNNQIQVLVDVQPLQPCGIHQNKSQEIYVFLFDDTFTGRLAKYNRGLVQEHVFSTDASGQPLFNNPHRVFQNWNGDICVTDESKVTALDNFGKVRWTYDGSQNGTKTVSFRPRGICCDLFQTVIVSDENNHAIDLLDRNGQFLLTFQLSQHGVIGPQDLNIGDEKTVWLTDSTKIYKISYMR